MKGYGIRRWISGFIILFVAAGCAGSSKETRKKETQVQAVRIRVGSVAVPVKKETLEEIKEELERVRYGEERKLVDRSYRPPTFDSGDPYLEVDVRGSMDSDVVKIFYPLMPDKANVGYVNPSGEGDAVAVASWDATRALSFLQKFLPEIERNEELELKSREEKTIVENCRRDLVRFLQTKEKPRLLSFEKTRFSDEYLDKADPAGRIEGYKLAFVAANKVYYYHATERGIAHLVRVRAVAE